MDGPQAGATALSDGAPSRADEPYLVALVGPPNCGKTTLFNQLTGLRQKVANYPGVTVEKHLGRVDVGGGREIELVDLPGVHGFSARTLDEQVTRDVLEGRIDGLRRPDAIVLIVDSTRLENQLMLVEPILELGLPTLLVLNMADELDARGGEIDDVALASRLGVDVVRTSARTGVGIDAVRSYLAEVRPSGDGSFVDRQLTNTPRGTALPVVDAFAARRRLVREVVDEAGFVPPGPSEFSERLDGIVLHKVFGPLLFLAVVVVVFQSIFTWAVPLMDGIDAGIGASGGWLQDTLPDSWFRSLLVDGVWAGVGSVVIFLPQILILFLFLGVLEDSGYMARAAVIADRMMYRVGLQGRAFLPLLSGYACAIPAILAARTIDDERDRLATIFVTPFMTCSARLPVYALLIAAFIPARPILGPFLGSQAAVMIGLYALGIVAAVVTAFVLKRTLLSTDQPSAFVMELPPYRIPSPRTLALRLWDRSLIFLRRAGKIIFAVTVLLWILTQFPRTAEGPPQIDDSALGTMGQLIEPAIEPLGFDWRIGVGLITSLAAREVIVGTLGTIYGVEEADEESVELREILQRDLTPGAAIGLLVFFAFALQCMSTVAVMRRETAGWKWPTIQFTYMLLLGYIGAFLAYRLF